MYYNQCLQLKASRKNARADLGTTATAEKNKHSHDAEKREGSEDTVPHIRSARAFEAEQEGSQSVPNAHRIGPQELRSTR